MAGAPGGVKRSTGMEIQGEPDHRQKSGEGRGENLQQCGNAVRG